MKESTGTAVILVDRTASMAGSDHLVRKASQQAIKSYRDLGYDITYVAYNFKVYNCISIDAALDIQPSGGLDHRRVLSVLEYLDPVAITHLTDGPDEGVDWDTVDVSRASSPPGGPPVVDSYQTMTVTLTLDNGWHRRLQGMDFGRLEGDADGDPDLLLTAMLDGSPIQRIADVGDVRRVDLDTEWTDEAFGRAMHAVMAVADLLTYCDDWSPGSDFLDSIARVAFEATDAMAASQTITWEVNLSPHDPGERPPPARPDRPWTTREDAWLNPLNTDGIPGTATVTYSDRWVVTVDGQE